MKSSLLFSVRALTLITAGLLPACGERATPVQSGSYRLDGEYLRDVTDPVLKDLSLLVDRGAGTALFSANGQRVALRTLTARPPELWEVNCQTNVSSQRLEIVGLGAADLQIGAFVVKMPVLQASCSLDDRPEYVSLRADGGSAGMLACQMAGGLCDLPFRAVQ